MTFVVRDGDLSQTVSVLITKIDCASGANGNAGIVGALKAVGNRPHAPSDSVILGNDDALFTTAGSIRNIDGPIGCDHRMSVQPTALARINRHTGTICQPTVIASRAVRSNAGLGTVIDRVRISRSGNFARQRIGEWPTANRLVIGTARRTTTFVRHPIIAIIVGVSGQTTSIAEHQKWVDDGWCHQLRNNRASSLFVGEENRIEA